MKTKHSFWRTAADRKLLASEAVYLLTGFPVRLMLFIAVTVLISLGAGLAVLWIGLLILTAAIALSRIAAGAERRIIAQLTGQPAVPGAYQRSGGNWLQRLWRAISDPQSWLDLAWVACGFFVSVITWSIALVWAVGIPAGFLAPIANLVLSMVGIDNTGLAELLGLPFGFVIDTVFQISAATLLLLTLPKVYHGLARAQAATGILLLNSRGQLAAVTESRDAGRVAEAEALRRLERDIHDGPQQRLIRLNLDLARAKRQAASDPARAEELITAAMTQTQETLDELRQLSRGIAPPVLVDRGLEAAITEAAGRSIVPVQVFADVDEVPSHVSIATYYFVSEALANVNKHAQATACTVVVAVQDGELFATVSDDGVGGASLAKGHGLAGLADRLRSVGGSLEISSAPGEGTELSVVIPCGS